MKDRPLREPKDTKEEVLFDYDELQERDRRRRSRFIAYAVFLDKDEEQPKKKLKKGYQI